MYLGVVYSGENDVCGVTLSLYPHRNTNKIEVGNTSYFESGGHVEWPHSGIEST